MTTFSAASLAAALVLGVSAFSTAQADSTNRDLARLQSLLRQVAPASVAPAAAPLLRSGKFVVTGHIKKQSDFALPVTCYVTIQHANYPNLYIQENSSRQAVFMGNDGTCVVSIPYRWTNADNSVPVDISIEAHSGYDQNGNSRSTDRDLSSIPLPAQNATTNISFDVTL
jgi:hypothetical protein